MAEFACVQGMIDAPADAIWALLTDFGNPQLLAPSIDRCSVAGAGVGAVRIVESSRGLVIHERLLECDPDRYRFRYEILDVGDMPFANVASYLCTVTLTPVTPDDTVVEWRSEGRADGPIEPIRAYLEALYRGATENLRASAMRR